jgi:uncharacterized Zn finger protein
MNERQFDRRPVKPTANPRRVVGGFKLSAKKSPEVPWVIQRWMRLVETYAPGDQLAEGLEYGRLGQVRALEISAGSIIARVQGRMPKAYNVAIRLPTFTTQQWEPVIDAMLAQARYAATLLSGELPANIEDLFVPAGLRLFPTEPSDVAASCNCAIFTGIPIEAEYTRPIMPGVAQTSPSPVLPTDEELAAIPDPDEKPGTPEPRAVVNPGTRVLPPGVPWCKHTCCTMALVADRLASDPFLIFALRGIAPDDLMERLRQRRQAAGSAKSPGMASLVYEPHLPGVSDRPSPALESAIESFWTSEKSLEDVDLPIEPPEVSHPLLRRMGASPFPKAKFPIVGLLATCYDLIGRDAIGGDGEEVVEENPE